jgi:hypothetical protein
MRALQPLLSWRANREIEVGDKARGLLSLPGPWVPPFLVIDAVLAHTVEESSADSTLAALPPEIRREIEAHLFAKDGHLLIRSDGLREATAPGAGLSLACEASWAGLSRALDSYRHRRGSLGIPIVQRAIEPALLGVMSNARSLVADDDSWLVEGVFDLKAPLVRRLRPSKRAAGRRAALRATTTAELLARLRQVGAGLSAGRYRCEWVWEGERLWLVQADPLQEPIGDTEALRYLATCDRRRGGFGFGKRTALDPTLVRRFPKLRSRASFAELALPLVPMEIVTAEQWRALEKPLTWLNAVLARHRRPLVVRCDLGGASAPFLLPTSAPQESAAALADFIEESLAELDSLDLSARDILLLLSPLMAARASALVIADAESGNAEIDALWGFPDGLLNLPHDSFGYRDGSLGPRCIRHKPACLLLEAEHSSRARLGRPFDWEPTLRGDEIRRLAEWALSLSAKEGRPMQLMALCRVDGRRGPSACLPFHCWPTERESSQALQQLSPEFAATIRAREDLDRSVAAGATVRLDFDADLDRDVDFVEAVGRWAVKEGATLVFSGSFLGHTRAVLERTGAVVVSSDSSEIDWSGFRPAIVRTRGGLRRVRMVPAEMVDSSAGGAFNGLPDLGDLDSTSVPEHDLPGQPAMLMDDAPPR